LPALSRFCPYRTAVCSGLHHGLFGFATQLCWIRTTVCSVSCICLIRVATQLCRRRDTIMSGAYIYYVCRAHLCIEAVGITIIIIMIVSHKKRPHGKVKCHRPYSGYSDDRPGWTGLPNGYHYSRSRTTKMLSGNILDAGPTGKLNWRRSILSRWYKWTNGTVSLFSYKA